MEQQIVRITKSAVEPLLKTSKEDIIKLIGETELIKETSFAIQAVNSNDYLAQATPVSVAKCIFNCAITGLSLNPVMKLSYIVPRAIKGQVEAIFQPSYQGLVKVVTDTGSVKSIYAMPVYKDDIFEQEYGSVISLKHKPKFNLSRKDEDIIYFYAVATLHDGTTQHEVMQRNEVDEIRDRSDSYKSFKNGKAKSAIWVDHYVEMGKKTVIKRLCKYLPKSAQNEKWVKAMTAMEADNKDYPITEQQAGWIESLLNTSTLSQDEKDIILSDIGDMTIGDAENIIDKLKLHQMGVRDGVNISSTMAKEAVNEVINIE
mgnify:CR=1 FL=1